MEYRLLEYLAMHAGEVVSKTDILEHLYDFNSERFSNVIEVYISALRRRFDPTAALQADPHAERPRILARRGAS